MAKVMDLTGQRFGKLTVIEQAFSEDDETRWHCVCDCGNETIVASRNLRYGHTKSCGCLRLKACRENLGLPHGAKIKRTASAPRVSNPITVDHSIPLDMKALDGLAEGIVIQAVKDYRIAYSRYAKWGFMTPDLRGKIFSLQKFFLGEWFKVLSDLDGAVLLEMLEDEILQEHKLTRGDFDE